MHLKNFNVLPRMMNFVVHFDAASSASFLLYVSTTIRFVRNVFHLIKDNEATKRMENGDPPMHLGAENIKGGILVINRMESF